MNTVTLKSRWLDKHTLIIQSVQMRRKSYNTKIINWTCCLGPIQYFKMLKNCKLCCYTLVFEEMNFESEIFILVQKIKCMPKCDLELHLSVIQNPVTQYSLQNIWNGMYASNICHAILPFEKYSLSHPANTFRTHLKSMH